ncbi:MAG: CheR family methyltransferase [Cyanobacteriota bacterium]|nr:CheR family methyltransferase [Cyanobacteriota bacterium]
MLLIAGGAGALRPLVALLPSLPSGEGLAVVVALTSGGRSPTRLMRLLAAHVPLPVRLARSATPLAPNQLLLLPPGCDAVVETHGVRVHAAATAALSLDRLLSSLAVAWSGRGVAVLLSGRGVDGAFGLRRLRAAGGLTLAQMPASARWPALPQAAIRLGAVDRVLEPAALAAALAGLEGSLALGRIAAQLQRHTGLDVSGYKPSSLGRQLRRRMAIRHCREALAYERLLADDPEEASALVGSLMVGVTRFFRDPPVFDALQRELERYGRQRSAADPLRVWVPGCASGEEVYTLAMVISAALGHPQDLPARLRLFATDLDERALAVVRSATYPIDAAELIPLELRQRFTCITGDQLQISRELRSCVVVARHNLLEDPPLPALDLVSCRNTLIYFSAPRQEQVLNVFRFALVPGGLLLLGLSDSLGGRLQQGFAAISRVPRLHQRRPDGRNRRQPLAPLRPRSGPPPLPPIPSKPGVAALAELPAGLPEALLRAVCGPSLLLDERHELLGVVGDVDAFCRLPEGGATLAARAVLRPELQAPAQALLLLVRADAAALRSQPLSLADGAAVCLEVRPLQLAERTLLLLSFLDAASTSAARPVAAAPTDPLALLPAQAAPSLQEAISRLEQELIASQEHQRRSLEALEQANEELEASSEELQASSEELQSANEELEASNEELQAANDELQALNQQLRSHSQMLESLNHELEHIQRSLSQGMVIVDHQLRVRRFSPLAVRVFGLVADDIGKPLLGVPTALPLTNLREALQEVVSGSSLRRTMESANGDSCFQVQIVPYQQYTGETTGAILTLTDISEEAGLRRAAEAALGDFLTVVDNLELVVWKRDLVMGQLLYVSRRIEALSGWSAAELLAAPGLLDGGVDPDDRERLAELRASSPEGWVVEYGFTDRHGRPLLLREQARRVEADGVPCLLGTLTDLTPQRRLEQHLRDQEDLLEALVEAAGWGVLLLDEELRLQRVNGALARLLAVDPAMLVGVPLGLLLCPGQEAELAAALSRLRTEALARLSLRLAFRNRDGSDRELDAELRPLGTSLSLAGALLLVAL